MHPRLDHFIVRPDAEDGTPGPIVPLVAVDQLPKWMELSGVPRELDAEQTIGLTNLGIVDKEDDGFFEVRLHHGKIRDILNYGDEKTDSHSSGGGKGKAKATKKRKTVTLADTTSKSIGKNVSEESFPTSARISSFAEPGLAKKPPPRTLSASRHNTANIAPETKARDTSVEKPIRPHMTEATREEPRPAAPKDTATEQDKQPTTLCRYWCHNGKCGWGTECHYQHNMPTTAEGLREVGLKHFPAWYLLLKINAMLGGLGEGQRAPAQQRRPVQQPQPPTSQPLVQQHDLEIPSPDLRDVQDRLSALLGPGGAASKQQKTKELREMRDLLQSGAAPAQRQQPRPHHHHHNNNNNKSKNSGNYANLYTNASVAANAASIRRQAKRQQQVRDDMPVLTRVRAREVVEDNWAQGAVAGRASVVEENLLDID